MSKFNFKNVTFGLAFAIFSTNSFANTYDKCGNENNYTKFLLPTNHSEYVKELSDKGVCVFKHKRDNHLIFIADLKSGVKVDFKELSSKGTFKDSKGYIHNLYTRGYIDSFFDNSTIVAINGSFFDQGKTFTDISFPVKKVGTSPSSVISYGSDFMRDGETDYDYRTLEILTTNNLANVHKYNNNDIKSYSKNIVGFRYDFPGRDQNPSVLKRRTFGGVRSIDTTKLNGNNEFLIFAVSESKTAWDMASIMNSWGVSNQSIVMFDGGASTQAKYKTGNIKKGIEGKRSIPIAIKFSR